MTTGVSSRLPQQYFDVSGASPSSTTSYYTPQEISTPPSTDELDLEERMKKRRELVEKNSAWDTTPMKSFKSPSPKGEVQPKALFKEEKSKVNPPAATNGHKGCCIIV